MNENGLTDIEIIPYILEKEQYIIDDFLLYFDEEGYTYHPLNYNGVANPSKQLIMLLGGKEDMNLYKWIDTLIHEIFHLILQSFEINGKFQELIIRNVLCEEENCQNETPSKSTIRFIFSQYIRNRQRSLQSKTSDDY